MVILVKEENPSPDGVCGGESSQSHLPNPISEKNRENPDEKIDFPEMGIDFSRESEMGCDDFKSKPSKTGDSVSLDLTLSHLCENPKLVFPPNERNLRNSFEKVVCEYQNQENNGLIERDFLRWNEVNVNTSKRQVVEDEEIDGDNREKKPKLETLNLSLALSLFLAAASNPIPTSQTTNTNTQTTYSNDFTAASSSYSCPHPFSDNPSSSLTCDDTTESYEYSVGSSGRDCEHIWNGGEGTNGSVDSRFRPIGDGVALSNHGGGSFPLMQGNRAINNDSYNSFYLATSSNNHSFFPSTLQASENVIGVESLDGGRARKLSRPEGIIQEVVSESILVMSQGIQELPDEALESLKKYLKKLIATPERKEELVSLQKKLEGRSYLNKETLSKTSIKHLEILVSVKTGLGSFLSSENRILPIELVEIFLLERCRNINCMSALPVDDCDCMICSTKKGFCSECICLVCLNFDCAKDTCSWVGCDVCSHWCHAACGLQRNLIKPGPSLDGPSGTTEMQFHCLGCGYASEMFGFVKDVFMSCAKDWDLETLMKELDCVREIFQWSEDFKGKKLHVMADRMLFELESKSMSPSHVCNFILQFFDCPILTLNSLSLNTYVPNPSSSNGRHALHQSNLNTFLMGDNVIEDDMWAAMLSKEYGFDLESFVQFKEAEARMYQTRADKVRRESENYSQIVQMESDRLEEEYAKKLTILCLQETEELRRKKLEHLKNLEDAYMDYYKLMASMQAEIASLLERMEATRQRRE